MDNFRECLVRKRNTSSDTLKRAGIGVLCALLAAAAVLFIPLYLFPFNLAAAIAIFYGGYYFMSATNVEYEYILTNDEIDFDKIIAKRKRKRLVTAKISTFENFGTLKEAPAISDDYTTVKADDCSGENEYFCDFKHASFGNVRVIFTPDEEMVKVIETALPGPLKTEYKRRKLLNK